MYIYTTYTYMLSPRHRSAPSPSMVATLPRPGTETGRKRRFIVGIEVSYVSYEFCWNVSWIHGMIEKTSSCLLNVCVMCTGMIHIHNMFMQYTE